MSQLLEFPKQWHSSRVLFSSYIFTWEVKRNHLDQIGWFQTSPKFTTGLNVQRVWRIRFYSNGVSEPEPDGSHPFRISLVKFASPKIQGRFKISVLCTRAFDVAFYSATMVQKQTVAGEGIEEFMFPNKQLRPFRERDTENPFTIRCRVWLQDEDHVEYSPRLGDLQKFATDMKKMDEQTENKDFTFVTSEDLGVYVHKYILTARSEKYRKMYDPPDVAIEHMAQNLDELFRHIERDRLVERLSEREIAVNLPYQTVKDTVSYMYSGAIQSTPSVPKYLNLHAVAEEFDINGFEDTTLRWLALNLTVQNVQSVLKFSDENELTELRKAAMLFVAKNLNSMSAAEMRMLKSEFNHLMKKIKAYQKLFWIRRGESLVPAWCHNC